ncbi:methylated-DNA--[protein]-cysteine S-methyltransferase [Amycolatopsis sp. NPDC059021]|uniref:methylated-DNA--[protein]-cysteine S-methyltransferase n=1 Tax=Amycolatopsis sp. NPDC059021 TaxID=3346704 RepID=UPI00366EF4F2
MTVYTTTDSPLGELLLVGEESGTAPGGVAIASLSMPGQKNAPAVRPEWRRDDAAFAEAVRQIRAFFAGELTEFDLEFTTTGSGFQQRIWQEVAAIPFGSTTTYGELAERLGLPRERVRAVGAAVGANPVLLMRPCHRVIGADGGMRGYAGGVERKVRLLAHEGVALAV